MENDRKTYRISAVNIGGIRMIREDDQQSRIIGKEAVKNIVDIDASGYDTATCEDRAARWLQLPSLIDQMNVDRIWSLFQPFNDYQKRTIIDREIRLGGLRLLSSTPTLKCALNFAKFIRTAFIWKICFEETIFRFLLDMVECTANSLQRVVFTRYLSLESFSVSPACRHLATRLCFFLLTKFTPINDVASVCQLLGYLAANVIPHVSGLLEIFDKDDVHQPMWTEYSSRHPQTNIALYVSYWVVQSFFYSPELVLIEKWLKLCDFCARQVLLTMDAFRKLRPLKILVSELQTRVEREVGLISTSFIMRDDRIILWHLSNAKTQRSFLTKFVVAFTRMAIRNTLLPITVSMWLRKVLNHCFILARELENDEVGFYDFLQHLQRQMLSRRWDGRFEDFSDCAIGIKDRLLQLPHSVQYYHQPEICQEPKEDDLADRLRSLLVFDSNRLFVYNEELPPYIEPMFDDFRASDNDSVTIEAARCRETPETMPRSWSRSPVDEDQPCCSRSLASRENFDSKDAVDGCADDDNIPHPGDMNSDDTPVHHLGANQVHFSDEEQASSASEPIQREPRDMQ